MKKSIDAWISLTIMILSFFGMVYGSFEEMNLTVTICFYIILTSICYLMLWVLWFKPKRKARRLMSSDETNYFTRTGIRGYQPRISGRPWPRKRDQWDARRNTWDTGRESRNWSTIPSDRRNRE